MASINRRINGIIFFFIILMLFGRLLNVHTIERIYAMTRTISEKVVTSTTLQNLAILFQKLLMPANDYLVHGRKEEIAAFENLRRTAHETLQEAKRILRDSSQREALVLFEKDLSEITRIGRDILKIENPVGSAQEAVLMEQMDAVADKASLEIDRLVQTVVEEAAASLRVTQKNILVSRTVNILITVLWVAAGLSFGLLMSRSIVKSVRALTTGMQKVSQGDFSHQVIIKSNDELQQMADTFNWMTAKVKESQDALQNRGELLNTANQILAQKLQEIKETEEKLYNISEMANDAIILIDDEGRVTFWNKAAERLFDYSKQEILGQDLHSMIVPQRYRNDFRKGRERFRTTGQGRIIGETLEMEAVRKDGREFPVELSISALKLKDRWHALGVLRDITERKKDMAETAKRTEELNRINKELKEFTSSITGREMVIIDLKREVNALSRQLGKEPPHDLSFLDKTENKGS